MHAELNEKVRAHLVDDVEFSMPESENAGTHEPGGIIGSGKRAPGGSWARRAERPWRNVLSV